MWHPENGIGLGNEHFEEEICFGQHVFWDSTLVFGRVGVEATKQKIPNNSHRKKHESRLCRFSQGGYLSQKMFHGTGRCILICFRLYDTWNSDPAPIRTLKLGTLPSAVFSVQSHASLPRWKEFCHFNTKRPIFCRKSCATFEPREPSATAHLTEGQGDFIQRSSGG